MVNTLEISGRVSFQNWYDTGNVKFNLKQAKIFMESIRMRKSTDNTESKLQNSMFTDVISTLYTQTFQRHSIVERKIRILRISTGFKKK